MITLTLNMIGIKYKGIYGRFRKLKQHMDMVLLLDFSPSHTILMTISSSGVIAGNHVNVILNLVERAPLKWYSEKQSPVSSSIILLATPTKPIQEYMNFSVLVG